MKKIMTPPPPISTLACEIKVKRFKTLSTLSTLHGLGHGVSLSISDVMNVNQLKWGVWSRWLLTIIIKVEHFFHHLYVPSISSVHTNRDKQGRRSCKNRFDLDFQVTRENLIFAFMTIIIVGFFDRENIPIVPYVIFLTIRLGREGRKPEAHAPLMSFKLATYYLI